MISSSEEGPDTMKSRFSKEKMSRGMALLQKRHSLLWVMNPWEELW